MNSLVLKFRNFLFIGILIAYGCQDIQENDAQENRNTHQIISWNKLVMEYAIAEDGLLTLKGVRTAAMMHIAIHNALNTINPKYETYQFKNGKDVSDAEVTSAIAQAAYEVINNQFPENSESTTSELNKWLDLINDGQSKTMGINLGKKCAISILEERNADAYNQQASYEWHPMAPGVYAEFNEHSGTPDGFIFGAGWAKAKPFALKSPDQFRSPPPPAISSDDYTTAFNEVKEFGNNNSTVRTQDQSHLAMWWKDFVENSHNRLARDLVVKEKLDEWETARLFAMLNMSIYDAYVNVFDNKFHYNHWRPYTAIRWAANDENPETKPDTAWNNLHKHTYAFPSYPSAHGTASTAAMTALAHTLGKGDSYGFVMQTDSVDVAGPFSGKVRMEPTTRTFKSFSEAGMEAAMSRVYLGIHFRYDSEEGFNLGQTIGNYIHANYLKALKAN